ncbi:hypothetical protein GCM10007338_03330 [Corynebacterium pelargi]|nr:hypothetical protein GCM10007338_03330 [Corynebacterium pelargi]
MLAHASALPIRIVGCQNRVIGSWDVEKLPQTGVLGVDVVLPYQALKSASIRKIAGMGAL